MKYLYTALSVSLLATCFGVSEARAADEALAATLRDVMENQTAAYGREDERETLSYIHTKSPDYSSMRQTLPEQFSNMDVRAEVVDFRYLGHDDEFAVARAKIKTEGESEATFAANVIDAIVVFHQEDGNWKLWSDEILGVELVQ